MAKQKDSESTPIESTDPQGRENSYFPAALDELPEPSPAEARAVEIAVDSDVGRRIKEARSLGPSVRQQTQAEILNMVLVQRELGGNPFSVKRLPFSIMRDMSADPTIAFALYYIETPLINATFSFESPDAQLAAAVDEAFRPINSDFKTKSINRLRMGYQPMAKRWGLGQLGGSYRDRNSDNPDEDKPIWDSKNIEPLVFKTPLALPPENCLPSWDEYGNFNGFMYSYVPIPNPMMLGVAQTYGPQVIAGSPIPREYAMWLVNERSQNYGSLYGQPRLRRAYRYWWSFWFRWALADRSYENKADPAKLIYYPTQVPDALDAGNDQSEIAYSLQQKAISTGRNIRSGSVVAFPGDFMVNEEGKTTNTRQWEASYMEGGENFNLLEQGFSNLQIYMMRAMFLPEQAFIDATSAAQSSSQRYIAAQQGEIYQESQQLLSNEDDETVNKYMIPEFIAANFPEKIGTPCKKVTRKLRNPEFIKQLVTLLGQKNPENLGVDVRSLLEEEGIKTLSEAQQKLQEEKSKEKEENDKPPVMAPQKTEGIAGYNAGVEKTETGEHIYFQPGDQILLSTANEFISSLPKIPPYEDSSIRGHALQMRKLLKDRYKEQVESFADQIRARTILKLAQQGEAQEKPGLGRGAARIAASGAITGWLGVQAATFPVTSLHLKQILAKIVGTAGKKELKLANLDQSVYDPNRLEEWAEQYANDNLKLMDQTVQNELKEFLEDQLQINSHPDAVAQAIEDHFEELPETHTARAVRAQTRDAYNKGMLQAAVDAGIDQVLAHDASDGTNPRTDSKCVQRNGKIFTPHSALKETEHPNGTLYFSYLNTSNLSVIITNDIPNHLDLSDKMQAGYDVKSETLFIKPEAEDRETDFIMTLGERLRLR